MPRGAEVAGGVAGLLREGGGGDATFARPPLDAIQGAGAEGGGGGGGAGRGVAVGVRGGCQARPLTIEKTKNNQDIVKNANIFSPNHCEAELAV